MKKNLFLILFTLVLSISLNAQPRNFEHLSFMNIPIDGSITSFQNKLIAKGFVYDKIISQSIEGPTRYFTGQFAGESVGLYVYYDHDQKFLYRVKITISREDVDQAISIMNKFRHLFEEKYGTAASSGTHENWDAYSINLKNGAVDLFITEQTYTMGYTLHVDYWDFANTQKHEANNMNDL